MAAGNIKCIRTEVEKTAVKLGLMALNFLKTSK